MQEFDIGVAAQSARYPDRSVQITGTFGAGGSITLKGSNDGVNYFALTDPQGNPITAAASCIKQITELTQYTKPEITGGDSTTNIAVTLFMKYPQPFRT